MERKKQFSLFLVMLLIKALPVFPQKGLYVSQGTNLFIKKATSISIDSLVLTPSSDFIIKGANYLTRHDTLTHPLFNPHLQRAFLFVPNVPSFSGDLSIYYQDKDLNGLSENLLNLKVHDGVNWQLINLNFTRDTIRNFVTTTAINNIALNELTLVAASVPLPIFLTSFNSACISGGVKLSWKTSQQFNLKNFEVEKSIAGIDWKVIGTVSVANIGNIDSSYTFTDSNSSAAAIYRIIIYDFNGRKFTSTLLKPFCTHSIFYWKGIIFLNN